MKANIRLKTIVFLIMMLCYGVVIYADQITVNKPINSTWEKISNELEVISVNKTYEKILANTKEELIHITSNISFYDIGKIAQWGYKQTGQALVTCTNGCIIFGEHICDRGILNKYKNKEEYACSYWKSQETLSKGELTQTRIFTETEDGNILVTWEGEYDPLISIYNFSGMTRAFSTKWIGGAEATISGITLSTNGTFFYLVGTGADRIRRYVMTTPFDVFTATQDVVSPIASLTLADISFAMEGTKLFILDAGTNDTIVQYNQSVAWNISIGSAQKHYNLSLRYSNETIATGLYASQDGCFIWFVGTARDRVFQLNLTTCGDLSSYVEAGNVSITAEEQQAQALSISQNGSLLTVLGQGGDNLIHYNMTPNSITTATFRGESMAIERTEGVLSSLYIDPNMTVAIIGGSDSDNVIKFNYTWNMSEIRMNVTTTSVYETSPSGIFINANKTYLFVVGTTGDDVTRLTITNKNINYLSGTINQLLPTLTVSDIYLSPDGSQMYFLEQSNRSFYHTVLTTSYDPRTYINSSILKINDESPNGFTFCNSTVVWVTGYFNKSILEYTLALPWNLTGAVLGSNMSINMYDTQPYDITAHSNGTLMYLLGNSGKDITEFSLTQPCNLSTATYVTEKSVNTDETNLQGNLLWNDTIMYTIGTVTDQIREYRMTSFRDEAGASTCDQESPFPASYTYLCSDNCLLGLIDAGGYNVTFSGAGTWTGNLTNYDEITVTGGCHAWVSSGGFG